MPLDGLTPWQPSGWSIRIGPTRALLAESRHWSARKRRAFHWLALDAAYAAIDAIQSGYLHRRRDDRWHGGSWIRYFFRLDHREKRTILITISHFHFFGPESPPDGPNAGSSLLPVDLLILHVSGSGRRYRIDRIEGVMPLPRPPARNRIVSLLEQLSRGKGSPGYVDIVARPTPDGRTGRTSVSVGGGNTTLYYSPAINGAGRVLLELDKLYRSGPVATLPRSGFLAQLGQVFSGLQGRGKPTKGAKPSGSANSADGFTYSVAIRDASAWPSTVAQTHLQLRNRPIRP